MGSFSTAHWIVVAIVVLILFGGGRISALMGDFGLGIRNFRKGLSDADEGGASGSATMAIPGRGPDAAGDRSPAAPTRPSDA